MTRRRAQIFRSYMNIPMPIHRTTHRPPPGKTIRYESTATPLNLPQTPEALSRRKLERFLNLPPGHLESDD